MGNNISEKLNRLSGFSGTVRDAIEYCLLRRDRPELVRRLDLGDEELHIALAEKKKADAELAELSLMDDLTGIPNQYCLDKALGREFFRSRRSGIALTLILFEVDFFSNYLEFYGRETAENCLRQIARVLARTIRRPTDLVARCDGDKFAAVLPDTTAESAEKIARTILADIQGLNIPNEKSHISDCITASIGLATMDPQANDDYPLSDLVAQADQALYRSRKGGRNRVMSISRTQGPVD